MLLCTGIIQLNNLSTRYENHWEKGNCNSHVQSYINMQNRNIQSNAAAVVCVCVCVCIYTYIHIYIYIYIHTHTGCHRRNVPDFGRVFLMLRYTDITQNTYVQSWTVAEIMAREVWNFDSCYTLIDYQIYIKTSRNMWFL